MKLSASIFLTLGALHAAPFLLLEHPMAALGGLQAAILGGCALVFLLTGLADLSLQFESKRGK